MRKLKNRLPLASPLLTESGGKMVAYPLSPGVPMTNLADALESLLDEIDGLGGAHHMDDDTLAFYEEFRRACLGLLADHPTMDIQTAFMIGEAIGCARFSCWDGASYELQSAIDRLGE